MAAGHYTRTEEILKKQSEAAKRNYELGIVNQAERNNKHRQTLELKKENNEPIGRRSAADGGVYIKKGVYKSCPVCGTDVYYKPKEIENNKRKCCSKKCLFQDPVYISKLKAVDRTYPRPGLCKLDTQDFKKYKNDVHRLTQKVYEENIDIINPNRYSRTLCGVEDGWQLDHIKTIRECFDEGWTAEQASAVTNLRMLPWKDNLMRNYEFSIQKD